MSRFSTLFVCLIAVFFCKNIEAQSFYCVQNPTLNGTPTSPCEPQTTTAEAQILTPASTQNYHDPGPIEIIEIQNSTSPWKIEGGGGTPVVDTALDETLIGESILADHQQSFAEVEGVYPPSTLNGEAPVYGSISGQHEAIVVSSEAQQPSSVEVELPVVAVPEVGSFDEVMADVGLSAFESNEIEDVAQAQPLTVVTAGNEGSITEAPLEADAVAPGRNPASEKAPDASVVE